MDSVQCLLPMYFFFEMAKQNKKKKSVFSSLSVGTKYVIILYFILDVVEADHIY